MSTLSEQNCDLYATEIELLKQALADRQSQLLAIETNCLRERDRQAELEDSIIAWQDKYDRLYESHKRVQKVNQTLEDKLLKLVDRNSGERAQLTSDVATLSVRLAQANYNIATLQREIERYKTDMSLAIQLLQCKPDSFVSQKVSSLPLEIQTKVAQYMRLDSNSHSDSEGSTTGGSSSAIGVGGGVGGSANIGTNGSGTAGVTTLGAYRVLPATDSPPPLCTFPASTAIVYSMRGIDEHPSTENQMISPSIIAKYLEDELKSNEIKHCDTCVCKNQDLTVLADTTSSYSVTTQTTLHGDGNMLCLRCNNNLNSPSHTNSPYPIKLVKSSDSVISETKSSVSGSNDNEKLFTPIKKDDLMVNPILGHHRLCDRTPKILETSAICVGEKHFVANSNDTMQRKQQQQFLSSPVLSRDSIKILSNEHTPQFRNLEVISNEGNHSSNSDSKISNMHQHQLHQLNTGSIGSSLVNKSTNTNAGGAKMFENFNRNLIKNIKMDLNKGTGPRLCALRIQNGSNNILVNNIESESTPIIYTRRSRLLDEELLDETKDIITSNSNISMVMSGTNITTTTLNKCEVTEKDKLPEIPFHSENIINHENNNNNNLNGGNNNNNNSGTNNNSNGDNFGLPKSHQIYLDKHENDTTMSSNKNANQSCTLSSSISCEMNMQESALLRRQQLTRVAEWVQNNHLDQIDPSASQSSISVDAASDDSCCKNKNQDTILASLNDLVVVVNNNNNNKYLKDVDDIIVANINNDNNTPSSLHQMDNCFGQSNICNNNNINHSVSSSIDHTISMHQRLQYPVKNCENECINGCVNVINSDDDDENDDEMSKSQNNLAQMEYNVKQFLLKQNEWSIHNKSTLLDDANNTISTKSLSSSPANITKNLHRTETNL